MNIVNLSLRRREFLGAGAAAAGALLLGFSLPASRAAATGNAAGGILNAFVSIAGDGVVTFMNPFAEMGQGTNTSVPMLVAEELDIPMSALRVEQAPVGPAYRIQGNGAFRITGGSSSVRSSFDTLRRVGATARAMLVSAAAQRWGVPAGEVSTDAGFLIHAKSDRRASYG
ncbi:MAG: molybdopterin cofactor-binding domain-containing protein, partial [Burkholderiales bacterium]